ncbi:OmpA family protein [Pseudomonas sp. CFBP 8770]|uniref:OmpA family protein n=1 Tax=unclassified Pseudomonas TaxID=196821 RepID=UPI000F0605D9|nr:MULTISPECIES: OmpA family protein [unclassified Pseudomonas]MBD8473496.1 OmpA family protein [Pseudomonas sp. CFBP 8773]MBD8646623.1 OmpA family protein [Pseudomonas sp. CFBP 8770]MBD8683853.1 OmpA family protein [Pseudomonas sp. CFBP 13719]
MKLKNTLGLAIGSLVAVTSFGVLAQGQGAVEVEGFAKKYMTDSARDYKNDGNLFGGSIGYFLTDDVELALSYDEVHNIRSDAGKNIKGSDAALDAFYHFGTPGAGLRPYVSAGFAHQSIGQDRGGRDHSTLAKLGGGAKYYFTENFYARAGVEALYNIDKGDTEWAPAVGVGVNFGGGSKPAPAAAPAPVAEVCADSDNDGVCDNVDKCPDTPANVTVDADGCPAVAETVRVELDVKFDFDKSVVKTNSYGDIKNLADFMKQYPQTTTTVEGHTDSVGPDAYNQKLSERRAAAVKQVLTGQYGVESNRVQSVGYGETRPVADNATDAGRAVNRRVEAEVEAQAK